MKKRDIIEQNLLTSIKRFEDRLKYLRTKSKKYSLLRLSFFLIFLCFFFYFFFTSTPLLLYITVAFIISFGILTGIHNKIERGLQRNILWIKIKKLHLYRMNLKWDELPPSVFTPDEKHPYDFDLSITGQYSLHRLINTSSSYGGSRILKQWLTDYIINPQDIIKRQKLVKEISLLPRFRDKLSLYSMLISKKELSGTKISEWINSPSFLVQIQKVLMLLAALIPVNLLLFSLYLLNFIPAYFVYSLILYAGVYWFNSRFTKGIFEDLLEIEDDFGKFSVIFDFLEGYPYKKSSRLIELCSVFLRHTPSKYLKNIKRTADAVSYSRNPLVGLTLNLIFPYNFFFAFRLEKLKSTLKKDLPEWLNTWYHLEAYSSLATYAYLNPDNNFPEIIENEIAFEAVNIAHPLIHPENAVTNNLSFRKTGDMFLITGSNMSGKSTFLKTLGINLVMAYSGGVVTAESLKTSAYRLQCCIKISDSVIDGISYFYAEVKRLKNILDELKNESTSPVFFLVDEIFKGTNNVERLIGSKSYIKEVIKFKGIGFVSTHDLELSRLENDIPAVKNYHFREEASEGIMVFDYKIHTGPCPTTNALKIMRSEGLPVD